MCFRENNNGGNKWSYKQACEQSHKKRKDCIVDIFAWTWNIWGGGFSEELLSENDFETVLATLGCYDYSANVSEAIQKIAADQKYYPKCSSCVIVRWIAKIYQ